jgi:KEOPS complex subunit Cgi121
VIAYEILAGTISIDDTQYFLDAINKVSADSGAIIQAINAENIAGKEHIDYAVKKAIKSFENGKNIAKDLGLEVLLYVSARRHIQKALAMGIREGAMDVLFVVIGEEAEAKKALAALNTMIEARPEVIDYTASKRSRIMKAFDITDKEVNAAGGPEKIPKLVLERVALFDAFK